MKNNNNKKIRTALITGKHPFDIPNLYKLFKSFDNVEFYPQNLDDYISDWGNCRKFYDVLIFYNFHQDTPTDAKSNENTEKYVNNKLESIYMKDILNELGEYEQGLFFLHHGILAFPKWEFWSNIIGIKDRSFGYHMDYKFQIDINNNEHPITKGLKSWEQIDETYTMKDPDSNSDIILSSDDPKSMNAIAWTRKYKNSKVLCYQSGHDNEVFANPNFKKIIYRGINWLANRI